MEYGLKFTDCVAYMRTMPTASVHLIIADSPYENTDLAFDKQPVDWVNFWAEVRRILAPTGVVICFAAELFTLDLIASNRAWYRYRQVWAKSRASRYVDKGWRPLCGHEDLVVFMPAPKSATYNPQKTARTGPAKNCQRKESKTPHYKATRQALAYEDDGTRYPTTVLDFPSVGTTAEHLNSTAKPIALLQYLVLTYSNPGEVVLEPFAGDAPTGHACDKTGRHYIGCEVNFEQYEYSQARLAKEALPLFA